MAVAHAINTVLVQIIHRNGLNVGKTFSKNYILKYFSYFIQKKTGFWHFMHIVSTRQFAWNVKSCLWENKENIANISSAELAQRVVVVK